ncbi:MAG: hypothetical protein ISS88_02740 [Candidatus Portnoybacteria bacterium]|nr:hypothetical protein [Candidatus Portnoybacteria bacterium]
MNLFIILSAGFLLVFIISTLGRIANYVELTRLTRETIGLFLAVEFVVICFFSLITLTAL